MDTEHLLWAQPTVEYLLARRIGESAREENVAEKDQPNGSFDQYGVWITLCTREMLGIFPPTVFVENHFGTTSEEFKFFRSRRRHAARGCNTGGLSMHLLHHHWRPQASRRGRCELHVPKGGANIIRTMAAAKPRTPVESK
jgi:hypothetical protein